MARRYQAPTVRKAFDILELIAASAVGRSISGLARDLSMSKSTVHGIMAALTAAGAVDREQRSKRYQLGYTLLALGQATARRLNLAEIARPVMERLMERTEETVCLGVRSGQRVTILESVESNREVKISAPVGTQLPLLAGATGKVFLAALPEDEAAELLVELGLREFTVKSVTALEAYVEELVRVAAHGYAVDDEEYLSGVRAVAAPVAGPAGVLAAIWVVGFSSGMGHERLEHLTEETLRAAAEIERLARAQLAQSQERKS